MNNNEQRVPTALKPLSEDPKFQKVLGMFLDKGWL